jgi:hypothetical protein
VAVERAADRAAAVAAAGGAGARQTGGVAAAAHPVLPRLAALRGPGSTCSADSREVADQAYLPRPPGMGMGIDLGIGGMAGMNLPGAPASANLPGLGMCIALGTGIGIPAFIAAREHRIHTLTVAANASTSLAQTCSAASVASAALAASAAAAAANISVAADSAATTSTGAGIGPGTAPATATAVPTASPLTLDSGGSRSSPSRHAAASIRGSVSVDYFGQYLHPPPSEALARARRLSIATAQSGLTAAREVGIAESDLQGTVAAGAAADSNSSADAAASVPPSLRKGTSASSVGSDGSINALPFGSGGGGNAALRSGGNFPLQFPFFSIPNAPGVPGSRPTAITNGGAAATSIAAANAAAMAASNAANARTAAAAADGGAGLVAADAEVAKAEAERLKQLDPAVQSILSAGGPVEAIASLVAATAGVSAVAKVAGDALRTAVSGDAGSLSAAAASSSSQDKGIVAAPAPWAGMSTREKARATVGPNSKDTAQGPSQSISHSLAIGSAPFIGGAEWVSPGPLRPSPEEEELLTAFFQYSNRVLPVVDQQHFYSALEQTGWLATIGTDADEAQAPWYGYTQPMPRPTGQPGSGVASPQAGATEGGETAGTGHEGANLSGASPEISVSKQSQQQRVLPFERPYKPLREPPFISVARNGELFGFRVCLLTVLCMGAKICGKNDLAAHYYGLARSFIGPCFTEPCQHLVSALLVLTLVARSIYGDGSQCHIFASLAFQMCELTDVSPEIRMAAAVLFKCNRSLITSGWPSENCSPDMTPYPRFADILGFAFGQLMKDFSDICPAPGPAAMQPCPEVTQLLEECRKNVSAFQALADEAAEMRAKYPVIPGLPVQAISDGILSILYARIGEYRKALDCMRRCVAETLSNRLCAYSYPLVLLLIKSNEVYRLGMQQPPSVFSEAEIREIVELKTKVVVFLKSVSRALFGGMSKICPFIGEATIPPTADGSGTHAASAAVASPPLLGSKEFNAAAKRQRAGKQSSKGGGPNAKRPRLAPGTTVAAGSGQDTTSDVDGYGGGMPPPPRVPTPRFIPDLEYGETTTAEGEDSDEALSTDRSLRRKNQRKLTMKSEFEGEFMIGSHLDLARLSSALAPVFAPGTIPGVTSLPVTQSPLLTSAPSDLRFPMLPLGSPVGDQKASVPLVPFLLQGHTPSNVAAQISPASSSVPGDERPSRNPSLDGTFDWLR